LLALCSLVEQRMLPLPSTCSVRNRTISESYTSYIAQDKWIDM